MKSISFAKIIIGLALATGVSSPAIAYSWSLGQNKQHLLELNLDQALYYDEYRSVGTGEMIMRNVHPHTVDPLSADRYQSLKLLDSKTKVGYTYYFSPDWKAQLLAEHRFKKRFSSINPTKHHNYYLGKLSYKNWTLSVGKDWVFDEDSNLEIPFAVGVEYHKLGNILFTDIPLVSSLKLQGFQGVMQDYFGYKIKGLSLVNSYQVPDYGLTYGFGFFATADDKGVNKQKVEIVADNTDWVGSPAWEDALEESLFNPDWTYPTGTVVIGNRTAIQGGKIFVNWQWNKLEVDVKFQGFKHTNTPFVYHGKNVAYNHVHQATFWHHLTQNGKATFSGREATANLTLSYNLKPKLTLSYELEYIYSKQLYDQKYKSEIRTEWYNHALKAKFQPSLSYPLFLEAVVYKDIDKTQDKDGWILYKRKFTSHLSGIMLGARIKL